MSRSVWVAAMIVAALALGCSSNDTGTTQATGGDSVLLIAREDVTPGASCERGGSIVRAGLDADGNGVLDPEEVVRSETICDQPPPPVLTRTAVEPPGATCAKGGTRVEAGADANGDGVLGDAEVQQTATLCDAPVPAAPPILTRVNPEAPGANCVAGGSAVRFGPDADLDGVLSDAEVAGTRFVCETRAVPSFVVRSQADADFVSAAALVEGSLSIEVPDPLDITVSPGAVTGDVFVRSSGLVGLHLHSGVVGGDVVVEQNASLTGFSLSVREALGGSVVVRDNQVLNSLFLPYRISGTFHYPADVAIQRNPKLAWFGFSFALPIDVAGDLVIEGNAGLIYLDLEGLTRVGGNFVLADNDAMDAYPNISPSHLTSVGGFIDVRDNAALQMFILQELESAGGLNILRNISLHTARFSKLLAVLGGIRVEDNPAFHLADSPEDPLRFVSGSITVLRNATLQSLQQWNLLLEVGARLEVAGNPELQRLGLARLVSAGEVVVRDSPRLISIGPSPGNPLLDPPSLVSLQRAVRLEVAENALLRQLLLPALPRVLELRAVNNPLLPTCQAMAIPARYQDVSGNDDAATCL